jgi:gas vesicle protein
MGKVIRFLAGFTTGMLVGAVAGIILAPASGDELRRTLRRRLQAVIEEGQQAAAERRAELQRQFAEARRLQPVAPGQM